MRRAQLIAALTAACLLVLVAGAADSSAVEAGSASAHAWAIRVVVPGQAGGSTRVLNSPPDAVVYDGAYAFPADGSVITAASVTTSVSTSPGQQASAGASAQATSVSLFKGEVTIQSVTGEAHSVASTSSASGDAGATGITGLVVLGTAVTPAPNQQIPLADWGVATALVQKGQRTDNTTPGYDNSVTALDIVLTAAHDGLPPQSEIQIGYANSTVQAQEPPPTTTTTTTAPTTTTTPRAHKHRPNGLGPVLSKPLNISPKQNPQGYVFPVYGQSGYGDTYGANRGDVSGGWHHGDDIFAPLGAPVLAVAHGTVFSVEWNEVGGWRLWLRDDRGWEYYYAHLSAYSPLAVNGAVVNAGDVLGFVGDTGDARGTPFHLHFEVHPVQLLGLGYDGAVDPTPYLDAWKRLKDVHFDAAPGWLPPSSATAPLAGAILLQSSDISSASGLDPDSLDRALAPSPSEGEGGVLQNAQPPPSGKKR